ncbi:hypothetical protein [Streptomyces sp. NPDC046197]|uniref:hypothetical protein n=1 Tax=Streptomyces sp. NPDC046197 TaxID=3154337 RepID=UPI0033EE403E
MQYHQFQISDEAGPAGPDVPYTHNGLVELQDGITTVHTGIHTGDVAVTISLHTDTPQRGDAEWDEIVEVSLHSASGDLMVRGLMDDLDEELPALSFDGPGHYRLRIHARGRDTAIDLAPDEITEYYFIDHRVLLHPGMASARPGRARAAPDGRLRSLCPNTLNADTEGGPGVSVIDQFGALGCSGARKIIAVVGSAAARDRWMSPGGNTIICRGPPFGKAGRVPGSGGVKYDRLYEQLRETAQGSAMRARRQAGRTTWRTAGGRPAGGPQARQAGHSRCGVDIRTA